VALGNVPVLLVALVLGLPANFELPMLFGGDDSEILSLLLG